MNNAKNELIKDLRKKYDKIVMVSDEPYTGKDIIEEIENDTDLGKRFVSTYEKVMKENEKK